MRALRGWALVLSATAALGAADHDNLEDGLPTSLQDAYPVAYRAFEAQLGLGYTIPDHGTDQPMVMPRLEVGILPNVQASVGTSFVLDGDRGHSGDLVVGALGNLNQESLALPAVAVAADLALPTGIDSRGQRGTALLILTKGPVPSWPDRLHLNIGWRWVSDGAADERDHAFRVALGYSRPLDTDTVLVIDGIRRQGERHADGWASAIEAGVRRQVSPLLVASLGGGVDLTDADGYAVTRVALGLQRGF